MNDGENGAPRLLEGKVALVTGGSRGSGGRWSSPLPRPARR